MEVIVSVKGSTPVPICVTDDHRATELSAEIQAHGLRPTEARIMILRYLRDAIGHPTAEQTFEGLHAQGCFFGVATVYQNLTRLVEAKLVRRFLDDRGLHRFDANGTPHHHFLCEECRHIIDLDADESGGAAIGAAAALLAASHPDWRADDARIVVLGRCPSCIDAEG